MKIEDVAHHLAAIPRFTGASDQPYSVAQHSWLCSQLVVRRYALDALLHDAHEAYIGDVSRPMKALLGGAWDAVENSIATVVAARFGVAWPIPAEVAEVDDLVLATEWRDVMKRLENVSSTTVEPLPVEFIKARWFRAWSPDLASFLFVSRFNELSGKRGTRDLAGAFYQPSKN